MKKPPENIEASLVDYLNMEFGYDASDVYAIEKSDLVYRGELEVDGELCHCWSFSPFGERELVTWTVDNNGAECIGTTGIVSPEEIYSYLNISYDGAVKIPSKRVPASLDRKSQLSTFGEDEEVDLGFGVSVVCSVFHWADPCRIQMCIQYPNGRNTIVTGAVYLTSNIPINDTLQCILEIGGPCDSIPY